MRESRTHAAFRKEEGSKGREVGGRAGRVWVRRGVCVWWGGVCVYVCVCAHSLRVHIWFLLRRSGENSTPEDLSPISVAGKRAQNEHGTDAQQINTSKQTRDCYLM